MKENMKEELLKEIPPYEIEELTKEEILGDTVMNYLVSLEDSADKIRAIERVKEKAREFKVTSAFNNIYKQKDKEKGIKNSETVSERQIVFPDMNGLVYNSNRYELDNNGCIYEIIPNIGRILVCYHPILPIQTFTNVEDNSTKVKIGYYKQEQWKYIIVDKSVISSSQSIIKLSDCGIEVNSETAKYLIKYLSEIENLNRDKITNSSSVSRLGWFEGELIPYSKKFEVDCVKDIPNMEDMFSTSGELEEWIEFFRERRKHNIAGRLIIASSVVSILLDKIRQPGFTFHIYGESEYGKTVACMVGQSVFGNPSQSSKGIGVNFNFTINGLESVLNRYNNVPLFINEMQHQKDMKDYDKILFLISEGKGKTRSTKNVGLAKQNNWCNVVITNGEKNIIKDNSNAGAYNRCFSYELTDYSYENLAEVADFVKENYGTPIRKILENVKDFDVKAIYQQQLEKVKDGDTTNKQKILQALILTGDKIVTDILFKDEYYLQVEELNRSVVKKKDIVVEERALELVKDWYVSEKRHFWKLGDDDDNKLKFEMYGRKINDNEIAFIPTILKNKLNDSGFDANEIINAWKRKGYLDYQQKKNTKVIRIDGVLTRCIVLKLKEDEDEDDEETDEMPF